MTALPLLAAPRAARLTPDELPLPEIATSWPRRGRSVVCRQWRRHTDIEDGTKFGAAGVRGDRAGRVGMWAT